MKVRVKKYTNSQGVLYGRDIGISLQRLYCQMDDRGKGSVIDYTGKMDRHNGGPISPSISFATLRIYDKDKAWG